MAKQIENGDHKPTHEEIAQRAQAIYEASGRLPGRDLDNWLQAETELQAARKGFAASRVESREAGTPGRSSTPVRTARETASRTGS
jgi:DUF2934 family protein